MHKTRSVMKHGTRSMYVKRKCRCEACCDANYEYIRSYKDSHAKTLSLTELSEILEFASKMLKILVKKQEQ